MKNNSDKRFEDLLAELLYGHLSEGDGQELAGLCAGYPDRARRIREELAFTDLLSQCVNRETRSGEILVAHLVESLGAEDDLAEQRFRELVVRATDDEIWPAECDELYLLCANHPERRTKLREELEFDDLLSQALDPRRSEEAFTAALSTRQAAGNGDDQFLRQIEQGIGEIERRRHSVGSKIVAFTGPAGHWAAAAAAVAITAVVMFFAVEPANPTVANVSDMTDNVLWEAADSDLPLENGEISPGTFRLATGVVRLDFGSGAQLTVEGPAEFEIRSENDVYLHTGMAAARAGLSGQTFRLQAPGVDVLDAGSIVAVDARQTQSTEAVVFHGGARVRLPGSSEDRNLYEFEAVRADRSREKVVDVSYTPETFAALWKPLSGIERITGDGELEVPGGANGSTGAPENGHSDEKVRIFLERDSFALDEVEVDSLEPGRFASLDAGTESVAQSVTPEGEVRSYLLQHWNADTEGAAPDGPIEASFTFSQPVVGVIFSNERLAESDTLVGAPTQDTLTPGVAGVRGLDSAGGDRIMLSDDRRTINIVLQGGSKDRLDHVRVIVAAR